MRTVPARAAHTPQPPRAESLGGSDTKGFHFIVTSSDLASKDPKTLSDARREHRRQAKSHVSRGRQGRAKGGRQLLSWVSKGASQHQHDPEDDPYVVKGGASYNLGGYFGDGAVLPDHVSALAIHDGIQCKSSWNPFSSHS